METIKMKKSTKKMWVMILLSAALLFIVSFSTVSAGKDKEVLKPKKDKVEFFGSPTSSISSAVSVPKSYNQLSFSGTVPSIIDRDGATIYERYGDTKTQAISILNNIKGQLESKGLSMKDVTYLRVYVTPDPLKNNTFDFQGWNEAYGQFFNTEENSVKTARSTVGVPALVNSDWLIEIEAFVAYK